MNATLPPNYLTPTSGRPSRLTLSQDLGFNPPVRFAEYVGQLYDYGRGDPEACLNAFDSTLGIYPCGADARYSNTPPELFPVGRTGCDGDHYGFLLHAPELELEDLPYGHFCPMDSDGVCVVGSKTETGIASVMAVTLSYDFIDDEEKSLISAVARVCGIQPQAERTPTIPVPTGWRFLPSSDGVGTLAPAEFFDSQPVAAFNQYGPPDPFVNAAELAMRTGHLATALHYLREGLWFCSCKNPFPLAQRMIEVYERMNRNRLANVLAVTMAKWRDESATA